MPFLYREEKFPSRENGELRLQKYWDGGWIVRVPEGEYYSGNYLEKMWRAMPRRYVEEAPKTVLILGSGAGCAIYSINKLWPKAKIDALDYDPVIIEIGKRVYGNFEGKPVRIFAEDAKIFLADNRKRYDLVIVDIFAGNRPSPLLGDIVFLTNLKRSLADNATIIANAETGMGGRDEAIFQAWDNIFPRSTLASYAANRLKVFVNKEIPENYVSLNQNEQYAEDLRKSGIEVICQRSSYIYIQRLGLGLGVIGAVHTDTEPDVERIKAEAGIRHGLIIWSQWRESFAPEPWRRLLLPPLHPKGNGLAYVDSDYRRRWSQTARRDLKTFESSGIEIKTVNKEDFLQALNSASIKSSLRSLSENILVKVDSLPANYWLAVKDRRTLGGLAAGEYDETSVHLAAFGTDNDGSSATGLIDHWYQHALSRRIKYLNFGHVRQPGETKSWQGFSDFKRKFIDQEIIIRNQYFRFF